MTYQITAFVVVNQYVFLIPNADISRKQGGPFNSDIYTTAKVWAQ